jgi:hypothetical protein
MEIECVDDQRRVCGELQGVVECAGLEVEMGEAEIGEGGEEARGEDGMD